jgi:ureidoacrylate peracid hydrolase
MQNTFMDEATGHAFCPHSLDIVPNVNRLAAAVRGTGGKVVWIVSAYTPETMLGWKTLCEMVGPERTAKRLGNLTDGATGHHLWHELKPAPEDTWVTKNRYSPFIPGASNLAEVLRENGIDTVLITGTVTNVCCESTARDAMMRNFRTIMISDGNAANTDADHANSLIAFYLSFGDVETTDDAIGALRAAAPSVAAE